MLREDSDDDQQQSAGADDEGEAGGSHKAKPKKFNDLATVAGLDATELYKLEVLTAADGSPVTVEALKDHYAKRSEFSVTQLQWEEERTRQQSDLVRGNAELRELISALPRDAIKPEVLEKVRAKHESSVARERARTLEVIPGWKDQAKMTEELTGMGEFLARYGYPPEYLKTVYDHRALLLFRDAWRREQRVKAALEAVEKVDTSGTPNKSKGGGKPPAKPSSGPKPRGRVGLESLLTD